MIDAVKAAREAVRFAEREVIRWFTATLDRPIEVLEGAGTVRRAAKRAYRDAVKAACHSP